MAISSFKLGPGTLTLGAGPLDVSAQVTKGLIEWSEAVTNAEAIPVLSGEEIPAEEDATYTAKLSCTFVQDTLAAGGLIAYSWTNKGAEVPFRFVPNDALEREVTGDLRVHPINIGGDVRARNTSDVSFACIGDPILGDVA